MGFFIITAAYKSADVIGDTCRSLAAQSEHLIAHIIVDGSCDEKTAHVIQTISEENQEYGSKVAYLSEPDTGIYNAMNKGVALALNDPRCEDTSLIALLNSDDYYQSDTLARVLRAQQTYPQAEFFYGNVALIDAEKCPCGERYSVRNISRGNMAFGMVVEHPALFLTARLYKAYGTYDESFKIAADYEYVLRMLPAIEEGTLATCYVGDKPLTIFRVTGISNSAITESMKEALRARMLHGFSPLREWTRYYRQSLVGKVFSTLSWLPGLKTLQERVGAKNIPGKMR